MERIQKMTVKTHCAQITYREEEDMIEALNTVEQGATINLTLVTVEDGYIRHTEAEDVCIDDIRVIGDEVFYDPAE